MLLLPLPRMSKKFFFILLPVIAIFFIYSNTGNAFPQATDHGFNITKADAGCNLPFSTFDLSKNNNNNNKNKIRIKAWDDTVPMAMTMQSPVFIPKIFFCERPIFFDRGTDVISACSTSESLRGPPAVI